MTNYDNGKIYKIVVNNTDEEYEPYIGSTTKKYLSQRLVQHRSNYKTRKSKNLGSFKLFDKYGTENCEIILIENYPCKSIDELRSRERYHYDIINNCNVRRPMVLPDDKKSDNIKRYNRTLELHPQYCQEIYQRRLELHPNFHKDKYQQILVKNPNFNEDRKLTKYECDCGKSVSRIDLKTRHEKSKKHINYLLSLENKTP